MGEKIITVETIRNLASEIPEIQRVWFSGFDMEDLTEGCTLFVQSDAEPGLFGQSEITGALIVSIHKYLEVEECDEILVGPIKDEQELNELTSGGILIYERK